MKNYLTPGWMYILSIILLPGFKSPNVTENNSPRNKPDGTTMRVAISAAPAKVSIADVRVVRSDKGQRPVDVMVCLSEITSSPVIVNYATKDRNAKAGADYIEANGSITFKPGETLKRISVVVIGEVAAEADEDAPVAAEVELEVNLTGVQNAILENSTAIITIIKDILRDPRLTGGNRSVYEVRLTHTGYTIFSGTLSDCPIRSNGKVVLTGLLSGAENVADEDDVVYTGTLQLDIDMDICSVKDGDPPKLCNISVTGAGPVETVLTIYFDGRGGYIQIKDTTSRGFRKNAVGTCSGEEIAEERTMIPLKTIASIFNGRDLPMLVERTLREGPYPEETDDQNVTTFKVLRKVR